MTSYKLTYNSAVQVCDATGDAIKYYSLVHKKNILLFLALFIFAIATNAQQNFQINFHNVAGNQPLNFDTTYTNKFGEPLQVRNFKYYVSQITLLDATGKKDSFPGQYFLIDERDETSKTILLQTRLTNITGIEFLFGVDSLKNVSGVQTGSLDPLKGMFWTWNSGYVMAKLEGRSAVSKTPAHAFSYHVGGYKPGESVAKKIVLQIAATKDSVIIYADILKWFYGKNDIQLSNISFCHEPGKLAMMLADNYADMFSTAIK